MRAQRFQTSADADAGAQHLASHGRLVGKKRVVDAELKPIDSELVRKFVIELFDGDSRLRHAEAAECAGRHVMGVHGARERAVIRHVIGTRGVDGDAVCDRRPPRRVGPGIEVGGDVERDDLAVAAGSRARGDARRMALRRRHHRFRPAVNHAHRAAQMPGGNGDEGLDRQIELGAETAADSRRHNPDRLRRNSKDRSHIVAIHVGRLRAGGDLDAIAGADGVACLRLDIGVLDEAGVKAALGDYVRAHQGHLDIAANDPAACKDIARAIGMQDAGAGGERRVDRGQRWPLVPTHGKRGEVERRHRIGFSDYQSDRFALETRLLHGKHRLVDSDRNDSERIPARHVGSCENADNSRVGRDPSLDIAELKLGAVARRTDHPRNERVRRMAVRAEQVGAVDLAHAVEAGNASADRLAGDGR